MPSPSLTPEPQQAAFKAVSPSTPEPPQAPFKMINRSSTLAAEEQQQGSDTHSIRSGRSLASSASSTIKHPEMNEPGLNSSIVETISAWFNDGEITKAAIIGEVALAFNPLDLSGPFLSETIRLNNFSSLDTVAPNPAFIEPVPDHTGSYTVSVRDVTKTAVAFKYQKRVEESQVASHTPLLLKSMWKIEPTQASVLVSYALHPDFASSSTGSSSVTMSNVILIAHVDPSAAKATSCKAMGGGIFSRERNLVYWRLGEIALTKDSPVPTLKARFFTDGEAKPGNIEARWEISSDHLVQLGTGLSVSMMEHKQHAGGESSDPFADEETSPAATTSWTDVRAVRKFRSGTYLSTP